MTFTLRPAQEEDAEVIRDLVIEGKINPTSLAWTRFVVAETAEGQVIGCGQIKPHRDGSMELASIAVTGAWRGRGVARAIIEYLIAGHEGSLYLTCRSTVGELYEKFGFRVLAAEEMPKYFRRISRLVGFIEPLRKEGVTLLVMGR